MAMRILVISQQHHHGSQFRCAAMTAESSGLGAGIIFSALAVGVVSYLIST